ncbi:hypothetical protein K3148_07920 [Qipengyuania aurantiaca]|uniref:Uncharacterized protein n=1 Tax=Qipengyuania aurantiaca TaxID=2867233 RepID=A0ABX8ZII1_9SPHN|nr:hypothetical protein [Qipengyuania aurantiaca]QZD88791.1 hypothetical protein K3148_07920 [Qipengyuania aurantiaca]
MLSLYQLIAPLFIPIVVLGLCSSLLLLVWPRSHYPYLIAALIPAWFFLYWVASRPKSSSDGWAWFGEAILLLAFLAAIVAVAVRLIIAAIPFIPSLSGDGPLDWTSTKFSALTVALAGAIFEFGPPLARAWSASAVLLLLIILSAAGWALVHRRWKRDQSIAYSLAATATLSVAVVSIAVWPFTVVAAAQRYAGDREFCLLVGDGEYSARPAANLMELSPLIMRATESSGWARNRHGHIVLADAPSAPWSYMRGAFVPDPPGAMGFGIGQTDRRCRPQKDYIANLPLL